MQRYFIYFVSINELTLWNSYRHSKSMDLFITTMHVFMLVFEFSFYAVPVEAVVTEVREFYFEIIDFQRLSKFSFGPFQLKYLSTAVYMSSWYERDTRQKKLLLFIMMKSQQQRYLSVAGLMDMNLDAFGLVCQNL